MTGGRKGLMRFLSRLLKNKPSTTTEPFRAIIPREHHPVSRKLISANALKVLYRLSNQGHDAWLVGGCIRDILLGYNPKDFDIATSASPETVRSLFRNSRIIGRRFKLIHVVFGGEVIEVATFRASHEQESGKAHRDKAQTSHSGRILRDNIYGTIEEDAMRRDFTINALYYSADDFTLHDFCGGLEDIDERLIRLIGDPVRRYQEDPVRMLRAIRFAAKLDFDIEYETAQPIYELGHLLHDIPAARLFDESLKMFLSGYALEAFHRMRHYDLFEPLFPATQSALYDNPEGITLIERVLVSTDDRIAQGKPVTPAFFYAAVLWPALRAMCDDLMAQGLPPALALNRAATHVIANQCTHTAIPKRFSIPMREIWELQHRLERHQPRRVQDLAAHPRFRAAYDFLVLREEVGEDTSGAGHWWTRYQEKYGLPRGEYYEDQPHDKSREQPGRTARNPDERSNNESNERPARLRRSRKRSRNRRPSRNQPD